MAKKSKVDRPVVTMECTECRERNYTTEKNRRTTPERLELRKYDPVVRRHVLHRESR